MLASEKPEAQSENRRGKTCFRVETMNNKTSVFLRFQQCETYRESQEAIGWTEETYARFDKTAREDIS